eukprot:gene23320-biopygen17804
MSAAWGFVRAGIKNSDALHALPRSPGDLPRSPVDLPRSPGDLPLGAEPDTELARFARSVEMLLSSVGGCLLRGACLLRTPVEKMAKELMGWQRRRCCKEQMTQKTATQSKSALVGAVASQVHARKAASCTIEQGCEKSREITLECARSILSFRFYAYRANIMFWVEEEFSHLSRIQLCLDYPCSDGEWVTGPKQSKLPPLFIAAAAACRRSPPPRAAVRRRCRCPPPPLFTSAVAARRRSP